MAVAERTKQDVLADILGVYVALSPENLWCDGEATRAQARAKEKKLRTKLQKLFKEYGRPVGEYEAYQIAPR